MNVIKQTGDNTFELNASPETMRWLAEVADVSNTDMATALNSALVQQWGGWAGYKRRAYLIELEEVQAVKGPTTTEDRDKDEEFTNPTSPEDAFTNILYGFLDSMVPKSDREKLRGLFTEIKQRIKIADTPEAIAKDAVNRAMSEETKCACGNPDCNNGFSKNDLETISKFFKGSMIFMDPSKRNE